MTANPAGATPLEAMRRILVIKLGALGDFVLAMGPFAAIRRAHPRAHIVLLTTAPFAELARASGYFDEVWLDDRPPLFAPARWLALRRRLRGGGFDRVYDLQTADRTGWYFRLMGPGRRPEWSGHVKRCSHPHDDPARVHMHTVDRHAAQLAIAGISAVPAPDLTWMEAETRGYGLAPRFVLLVPGGAPHRPRKRWPAARFGALAGRIEAMGLQPVVIGGAAERDAAREILDECAAAADLVGRTTFAEIAALARQAAGAVGNDTGPMHLIAAAGCPAVVLFSSESDPALTAPRGAGVTVLQRDDLAALGVVEVAEALRLR